MGALPRALLGVGLLGTLFCHHWFARRVTHHFCIENRFFCDAIRNALWDARLRLAFLPCIGHWFVEKHEEGDEDGEA